MVFIYFWLAAILVFINFALVAVQNLLFRLSMWVRSLIHLL